MTIEKPTNVTQPQPTTSPKPAAPLKITAQAKPRMSALALAARRANLAKARAAGREKIYRPTEKRQAASRANLARAIAARNTPSGNQAARFNALSHGISAKDVAGSVARLGEDEAEYREHQALFERAFAPQDEPERVIVRRLSDASWKRLRFFRAQAQWELSRLKKTLLDIIPGSVSPRAVGTLKQVRVPAATDTPTAPASGSAAASAGEPTLPLGVEETLRRAYVLSRALDFNLDLLDYVADFQSEIQGQLKQLLRKRSGGKMRFQAFAKVRGIKEEFEETLDDMLDRALKSKKMTTRLR